ncbi:hypothetical protein [Bacillus licheniformis]|uniref:hypothetical protein n=1 Tax=Bacillus licheniformis TaxID=1402 RepID=UPI0018DAA378|nr:hypothetical protein [Bacillus licheniformis]MEC1810954.1 hypothetical protein [Bacillus licheniformis]MED0839038.1 hypothetical protein [Bacillus licheniformis]MED0840810.1 hypothetical protein [Bacillus licheniformis]MED0848231.1 hypothetical protein [Bacillus licheniformis]MED0879468.1 hypothetical protein [Bacillus licheniformis]
MLDEILEFSTLSDFEVYGRNTGLERIVLKNGLRRINLELRTGYYLVKNRDNGNINLKVYKQREFEKKFESVDSAKKARKMAELSGMLTKNGFNFKETPKEEEIEKVESFEFNFDGKTKSKIEYKTTKDGSRYHTERVFSNFELDDNLREELQSIIGRIAEYFFENDKTLPMIEHTGITNAKIHNIPASAITGIDADLSGINLNGPGIKTAKTKDLSVDKLGPIESPEISPASSFEIEREAHKKLIKELIREVLSEKPVTMSLDGEEVGKACFKEVSKVMKRQDIEEVRPKAEEIDNYLRKNPSIKSQLIDLLKSRRGGFKK